MGWYQRPGVDFSAIAHPGGDSGWPAGDVPAPAAAPLDLTYNFGSGGPGDGNDAGVAQPDEALAERAYSDRQRTAGPGSTRPPVPDVDDPNFYELLGVPFAATPDEIRRAYRLAMKRIHPDRQRAEGRARAEEQAKLLNRAYATLSKPLARRDYDRTIRAQVVQDQIMSRYVGGFMTEMQDQHGSQLKRTPTAADKREQAQATRGALLSLLTAFVVLTAIILAIVILYALAESLFNAVV